MSVFRFAKLYCLSLLAALFLPFQSEASGGLQWDTVGAAPAPLAPMKGPTLTVADQQRHGAPLPDGAVATSDTGDIQEAWLSQPTDRYGHAVLGDAIEAQAVTIRLSTGALRSFQLPSDSVFEDLTPRLADLDGDGQTEVILVRSYLTQGAALAILGLRDDKLVLLAETPAIGTANRWLNPSILLDNPINGTVAVGLVRTPHIGGQLQIWQFEKGSLQLAAKANGFSNHTIGSRALGLSAVLAKGDARHILLPDTRQRRLMLVDGANLELLASIPLPARPNGNFTVIRTIPGKQTISIPLSNGKIFRLSDPDGHLFD